MMANSHLIEQCLSDLTRDHMIADDSSTEMTASYVGAEEPDGSIDKQAAWIEKVLSCLGSRAILRQPSIALICSVRCPGSIVIQTFDTVRELRDANVVMIGGFHSPMEREGLDFLLRGNQPIIICSAKGLGQPRLSAVWRKAIDAGRLLLVSPFADTVRRTTKAQAQTRNEFVAAISTAVLIPHASPGGKAEAIARKVLKTGKPLFTFDDPENHTLLQLGARPYNIDEIRRKLAG